MIRRLLARIQRGSEHNARIAELEERLAQKFAPLLHELSLLVAVTERRIVAAGHGTEESDKEAWDADVQLRESIKALLSREE